MKKIKYWIAAPIIGCFFATTLIFSNCAPSQHSDNSNLIAFEEGDTRNLKLIDDDMLIDFDEMTASNQEALDVDGQVVASKAGRDLTDVAANYWKNGLIPLKFESGNTQTEKNMVFSACAKWSKVADVDCVYYNSSIHGSNYLNVTKTGDGCYGSFGKPNSGPGYLNLSTSEAVSYSLPQGTCMIPGIIMHEFGHNLGMIHEHSRPDRDTYVTIHTANLKSTCVSSLAILLVMLGSFIPTQNGVTIAMPAPNTGMELIGFSLRAAQAT